MQVKKESLFQLCGKKKLDEVLQGVETEIETVQVGTCTTLLCFLVVVCVCVN